MLHDRSRAILYKILTDQSSLTAQQLSEGHNLSLRMIRYDLETIDNFLKKNGLPILHKKGKIRFLGSVEERAKAIALTEQAISQNRINLPDDRLHQIISTLLQAKKCITYEEIAQILDVSKSTVISDLNKLRSFYPYQSVRVEVIPRHGIYFSGDEIEIRESVVSFLFGRSEIRNLFFMLQSGELEYGFAVDQPLHIFHPGYLDRFARCIRNIVNTLKIRITDNTFIQLLLYLVVTSARIKSGHLIKKTLNIKVTDSCQYATEIIITELSSTIDFEISDSGEYGYLAGLMTNFFINPYNNRAELQILLLSLVCKIERLLNINLMQDMELLKTLDADIQAIVGNKSLFLPTYENIINQLKEHYPNVYASVKDSAILIEEYVGRQLSQEELTTLMIPFAEAAQRNCTLSTQRANILVVCSAGQATSRLLCYQLMSLFDVTVVDAIDFNQLRDSVKHCDVDYIVSTIPLKTVDKPSILVNPFLTPKDLENLKSYLPTKVIDHNLFTGLINVIEKNCHVINPKQLTEDIANLLSIKGFRQSESPLNLCDILKPENIMLDVKCNNWRDAVKVSGILLTNNGYAEESYTNEMVESVEQNGSFIVIDKGIAMPHAGLKSVNQVGMSFVRLAEPVFFGSPNDPVDLVFALCTPTKVAHLNALKQFSDLISDKGLLKKIREAKQIDEIVDIL
ncbi:MAG: PTS sugar transporter subunit IIA, partial [Defluviitaleaceae bacterium]|nr:PTS sugar transporter subunit IIA [Defluviitaleaceae bacterium]